MLRWIPLLMILLVLPALGRPERRVPQGTVQIQVVKQVAASTADPKNQLYDFSVKCTNQGQQPVRLSNNLFYVVDDAGQPHHVERGRYPEIEALQPGQSVTLDRIYIAVPRDRKPKEMHLLNMGSCPLK